MKKLFLMFLLPLCVGLMGQQSCFPGDGTDVDSSGNDAFGTPVHGPALSYTDNGDGTFTDNVTEFVWEIKDQSRGVHDVDNFYTWSSLDGDNTDPDGSLFTVFLVKLNDRCDGGESISCNSDADCTGIGNGLCGHAGHRDWCKPNVKRLQSIVDYGMSTPASSVPGQNAAAVYWSSTTLAASTGNAWLVNFISGDVVFGSKNFNGFRARAVRPCS